MKEKRLDFELLRILAIFGVVFNHSQERGFELYLLEGCSRINFTASLLLGIACETAVPLFLLVSGGLLLHKNESIGAVLKKRCLRILAVLVLFSGILYGFWIIWGYAPDAGLSDFLKYFYANGISAPYWYLYAYLSLMLLLPLLRPMVQTMPDRAFGYLFLLHLCYYGLLTPVGIITDWGAPNPDFSLYLIEPVLFYFIMGYYLNHRFDWDRVKKKQLGILCLLSLLSVMIMFLLAGLNYHHGKGTLDYRELLLCIPVFTVYALVHQLFRWKTPSSWLEKLITTMGSCVFGVYLMEGILRHYLGLLVYEPLEPVIHVIPACLVWVVSVVLCGLAITWILKKVPGIRALL